MDTPEMTNKPRISRRRLLGLLPASAAVTAVAGWWPGQVMAAAATDGRNDGLIETWVSAEGDQAASYGLGWITPDQHQAASVMAGFRGHGLAQNPVQPSQVLMFARAPGREMLVVNLQDQAATRRLQCEQGYHLSGHGVFSADGTQLFTCESRYETGEGRIVVRDSQSWNVVADYAAGGVGPHELKLMPDGQTLVIAVGGLRTHPDRPGEVLNLDSMDSSLVYMDSRSGRIISQWRLPESKASIRHLDVAADGTVAVATQVQRSAMQSRDLVALGANPSSGSATAIAAGTGCADGAI